MGAALGLAAVAVASNWDTGWICILWALAALAVHHGLALLRLSHLMVRLALAALFLAMAGITAKVAFSTLQAVRV